MAEPFLAEIRLFGFGIVPQGWLPCDGQILAINQNQALFSLLGTTYGGNGQTTFALPDLRGRVPVGLGNGVTLGQFAGEENHTLTAAEMPAHVHMAMGSSATGAQSNPTGNAWATVTDNPFSTQTPNATLNPAAIGMAGESTGHSNMQPYLTLQYCIATQGIFPSRN